MSYCLAVFTPIMGVISETFISRHIYDLLPDGTVVVADAVAARSDSQAVRPIDMPTYLLHRNKLAQITGNMANYVKWLNSFPPLPEVKRFLVNHQVQVILGEYLDCSFPWFGVAQDLNIPFFAHAHGERCLDAVA